MESTSPRTSEVIYVERRGGLFRMFFLLGTLLCLFLCVCVVPGILAVSLAGSLLASSDPMNAISEKEELIAGNASSSTETKLVVIDVNDVISYAVPGTLQEGLTSQSIIDQLSKAKADSAVKAIVLRFNSPGGDVSAAEPVCRKIKEVDKNIPVYSFIDSMGASLSYLLPNCTRAIYSRPSAITGSIGVIIEAVDFYGVLEHFGGKVTFVTNTAGKQKSGQDIYTPGSDTYLTYQKILDEEYEYFVNKVYEGRTPHSKSITQEGLKQIADGRIFSGKQAKELGLVDELAEYEDAIQAIVSKESSLKDKRVRVVDYSLDQNPLSSIIPNFKAPSTTEAITKELKQSVKVKMELKQNLLQ